MKDQIRGFRREYAFLGNFWPCQVEINGWLFPSAENAYQALKSLDSRDWIRLQLMTPGEAKRAGRRLRLRGDWDEVKLDVMQGIVTLKFTQNFKLMTQLLETGNMEIIEDNTWNDTFWGVCNGKGHNHLGKILMTVRTQIRSLNNVE